MTITTSMELSTSNLTRRTMGMLDSFIQENSIHKLREFGWPAMTVAPYDYGCFITVPGHDTDKEQMLSLPEDLHSALVYARNLGVDVIRFDKDAEADINLPTYDW